MIQWYEQFTPRDQPAGIYLRVRDQMPEDDVRLLHAIARVVLVASRGSLERQLAAWNVVPAIAAAHKPKRASAPERQSPLPILDRHYLNGFGGFTLDGQEYVVQIDPEPPPPLRG